MADERSPSQVLAALLARPAVALAEVTALLDGLDSPARIAAATSLGRREQERLWQLAEGAAIDLDHLVPSTTAPLTPVRHHGRNTLPAFTRFEKRFFRAPDGNVFGANFQAVSPFTGPGYFGVRREPGGTELFLDYAQLPASAPAGWPAVKSNKRGVISYFVYGSLSDRLRRVSRHVAIGTPAMSGKPMGSYFVLCREDAAS